MIKEVQEAAGEYEDKEIQYFPAACFVVFCAYMDRFFRLKWAIAIR